MDPIAKEDCKGWMERIDGLVFPVKEEGYFPNKTGSEE